MSIASATAESGMDLCLLKEEIARALPDLIPSLRIEAAGDEQGNCNRVTVHHGIWPLRAHIALSRRNDQSTPPHYNVWWNSRRSDVVGGQAGGTYAPSAAAAVAALAEWLRSAERELRTTQAISLAGGRLDARMLASLDALAKARTEASANFDALVETAEPLVDTGDDPAFATGVRRLVARNFPRDPKGNLARGVIALLAPRDPVAVAANPHARSLWYAAVGPERRRDPQIIRIAWHWCISENHTHRWDAAPWLWNPESATRSTEAERSGVAELSWDRLGQKDRDANLAALQADHSHAARVGQTLLLQDAGRLREALDLWGVRVVGPASDLLEGIGEPKACLAVREAAYMSAPWQFKALVETEQQRLAEWRAAKKGRAKKAANMALFVMPGAVVASRERLFLCEPSEADDAIVAELRLDRTAHEARLPCALWQRPAEIDLGRFGLLSTEETT